jgi:hypothetical protein
MRTKRSYAEEIILALQNQNRNIDYKTPDEREVFLRMDATVNELAAQSYFANWKYSGSSIDEQFLTVWEGDDAITVTDDETGSWFALPAQYADLPNNRGIDQLWPLEQGEYNHSAIIRSRQNVSLYKDNKAGNMQGRPSGYPSGGIFRFTEPNITEKYGEKWGLSLVIRDSSMISLTAPYPIPSDKVRFFIDKCVEYFLDKRERPDDKIRDNNDNKQ